MGDRAGQVYALIGGVLWGLSANALVGLIATPSLGWIAAGTFIVGFWPAVGSVAGWPLPGRRSRKAVTAESAFTLSAQIMTWLSDRRRDDPTSFGYGGTAGDWDRMTRASMAHSQDTITRWNERFAVRALQLYDELIRAGTSAEISRFAVEHPTNPLGMEAVAHALGVMAAKLNRT